MTSDASTTWAVVPAKRFDRAKSRLGAVLGDAARGALAQRMLVHVLSVLDAARLRGAIAGTLVITDGDDVEQCARALGAHVLRDPSSARSLAHVVDAALAAIERRGGSHALVLMADLPELHAHDLDSLLAAGAEHDVVIVPDQLGRHTNALLLSLGRGFTSCFGAAESAADHEARARTLRLRARRVTLQRVAFDVDTPDALQAMGAADSPPHA